MTEPAFDALETGRLMFERPWDFVMGTPKIEFLPAMEGLEIAFAGRSNVGKSSLINAVTRRKDLARTSHTPGRTQELNFFRAPEVPLTLVDMPGYGFAEAPKSQVKAWTGVIHAYMRGRANLARIYIMIDARHGLKKVDDEIFNALDKVALSYQIVFTKADQVKKSELDANLAAAQAGLLRRPAAFPEIIVTSSREGTGIAEFRGAVAQLLQERGML